MNSSDSLDKAMIYDSTKESSRSEEFFVRIRRKELILLEKIAKHARIDFAVLFDT